MAAHRDSPEGRGCALWCCAGGPRGLARPRHPGPALPPHSQEYHALRAEYAEVLRQYTIFAEQALGELSSAEEGTVDMAQLKDKLKQLEAVPHPAASQPLGGVKVDAGMAWHGGWGGVGGLVGRRRSPSDPRAVPGGPGGP